jgi:hypothetical protein
MTASAIWAEQARTNVGVLTYTRLKPDKDVGQRMTCGFTAAGTGADEKSSGTIRASGRELASGKVALAWAVIGPADAKATWLSFATIRAASGQPPILVGEKNPAVVLRLDTANKDCDGSSTSALNRGAFKSAAWGWGSPLATTDSEAEPRKAWNGR